MVRMKYRVKRFGVVGDIDSGLTDLQNKREEFQRRGNNRLWDALGLGNTWIGKGLKKLNNFRYNLREKFRNFKFNVRNNLFGYGKENKYSVILGEEELRLFSQILNFWSAKSPEEQIEFWEEECPKNISPVHNKLAKLLWRINNDLDLDIQPDILFIDLQEDASLWIVGFIDGGGDHALQFTPGRGWMTNSRKMIPDIKRYLLELTDKALKWVKSGRLESYTSDYIVYLNELKKGLSKL